LPAGSCTHSWIIEWKTAVQFTFLSTFVLYPAGLTGPDSICQLTNNVNSRRTGRSDIPDIEDRIEEVRAAKRAVSDDGRPGAVEKQHEHGKLTARERVDYLCTDFDEIGQLAAPARPGSSPSRSTGRRCR
jgi:hypothetical protein